MKEECDEVIDGVIDGVIDEVNLQDQLIAIHNIQRIVYALFNLTASTSIHRSVRMDLAPDPQLS